MSDRTINFGESETEATYQIQDTDSTGGGNFVVAKDTNANTVLLQYDPDTDTWEYAGDVDINGGNVSGVGTLTAESVNTEQAINSELGDGINYIDPTWFAENEYVLFDIYPLSLDAWSTSTSGSGSVDLTTAGPAIRADTGSESGSTAKASLEVDRRFYAGVPSFDDGRLALKMGFRTVDDDDITAYWSWGDIENGSDGYGFKLSTGNGTPTLQGAVHNGATETTVDLVENPGQSRFAGQIIQSADLGEVRFLIGGSVEGTIASDLPDTPSASPELAVYCENVTDDRRRVDFGHVTGVLLD